MRLIVVTMTMLGVGFSGGYFYSRSEPEVIQFKRIQETQEVRDDYFHKCKNAAAIALTGNVIEQKWVCPHMQVFIIKKLREKNSFERKN